MIEKFRLFGLVLLAFVALLAPLSAQTQTPASPTPATRLDETPHDVGFIKVNGVNLNYVDWGGKGEVILFLHGFPGSAHNFDEMAPKFTDRFRVLGLTRRGHGQSEKIETGYDVDTRVEDIRQFLDAMKIERVNLIGFSAGGDELTRFAGLYPRRTIKLVYMDAAYDRRDVTALEKLDPLLNLANEDPPTKIEAAMIKSMDEFKPDYKKVRAQALSYYAITETHWDLKPDSDESTKKKAQEYVEKIVRPRQWKNIEQFKKGMVNGRVVVLRNTQHNFFRDPKLKDQVVKEIREFLLAH